MKFNFASQKRHKRQAMTLRRFDSIKFHLNTAMSFAELPNETILAIIRWISYSEETRDNSAVLRSLSLCSRRFSRLVTPTLYSTTNLDTWNRERSRLITLLRSPYLGDFSKSLNTSQCVSKVLNDLAFTAGELVLCKKRIAKLCSTESEVDQWLHDLMNKDWSALASLMLSCLPNVETICLGDYEGTSRYGLERLFNQAMVLQRNGTNSPLALSKLKTFEGTFSESHDSDSGVSLASVAPHLRLPSVQKAVISNARDDLNVDKDMPDFEIDSLSLISCIYDCTGTINLVKHCKNLKSFELYEDDIGGFARMDDNYEDIVPFLPRLGKALSGLEPCLESLELHILRSAYNTPHPLGSLYRFQNLRRISVDAAILLMPASQTISTRPRLVNILPKSLQILEITRYDRYAVRQLHELLDERCTIVPDLVRISLEDAINYAMSYTDHATWERSLASIESLRVKCADVEVIILGDSHIPPQREITRRMPGPLTFEEHCAAIDRANAAADAALAFLAAGDSARI